MVVAVWVVPECRTRNILARFISRLIVSACVLVAGAGIPMGAAAQEAGAAEPSGSLWIFGVLVFTALMAAGGYFLSRRREPPDDTYSSEEKKIISATNVIGSAISIFAVLGIFGILVACLGMAEGFQQFASLFGTDVMVAAAAGATGALFGFIFGIPRTLDPASRAAVAAAAAQTGSAATTNAVLAANTNLERVSDWLTTLLIGATLVQIRDIPGWIRRLAEYVGTGGITNPKIVPFIAVYFFGLAFLGVYLITRLYLTSALTQTLGLLVGASGVSDVSGVRTMLANARAVSDPEVMKATLNAYGQWSFSGDDREDPQLNAELARLLAKYLSTGKADNVSLRLAQLEEALRKAAVNAVLKNQLKADFDNKLLTTGDATVDTKLSKTLEYAGPLRLQTPEFANDRRVPPRLTASISYMFRKRHKRVRRARYA